MFAIGDSLREARTRRGLSAADVQKGIRIRERYLTALEEERWELLPGEAYTKGFLRTYAEYLGLDGGLYIDEFNARVAHHDDELLVPESLAVSHRTRRGVLRMLMGLVILGAALVAGLAAFGRGGSAPAGGLGNTPVRARTHHVVTAAATAAAAAPVSATTPLARRTVITAPRGRCWLSVRTGGPTGAILFQGVLERGRTLRFAVGPDLWVRMGRPRNLDIVLGGHRVNGLPAIPGNVLLTQRGPQAA